MSALVIRNGHLIDPGAGVDAPKDFTSKAFADVINGGAPAALSLLAFEHVVASEGGFPIVVDGKLIGAIGASGGIATQDGVTATAGLNAVTPH